MSPSLYDPPLFTPSRRPDPCLCGAPASAFCTASGCAERTCDDCTECAVHKARRLAAGEESAEEVATDRAEVERRGKAAEARLAAARLGAFPCGSKGAARRKHDFRDGDLCSKCDSAKGARS